MVLRNIFKKKRTSKEEKSVEKPAEKLTQVRESKIKEKKLGEAWRILKSPHITEKATDLTSKNQYVFKVFPKANKNEIKKAVEDVYEVDVVSVKIINIPAKKRRLGRIEGFRKEYKKAIVKIKEGQKIELLPR